MVQASKILTALSDERVAFVLVGGMAAVVHGASYVTADLDICYQRQAENYERLHRALQPLAPCLRDAPDDLPFVLDAATLKAGLNFTLTTSAGDLDLWGEIAGLDGYDVVNAHAETIELYDRPVRVLTLEGLIRTKQAAGRPKDLRLIPELTALLALRDASE